MQVTLFSYHSYEKPFLERANSNSQHQFHCLETALTAQTASLAKNCGGNLLFRNGLY